jgi:hypothetical protein
VPRRNDISPPDYEDELSDRSRTKTKVKYSALDLWNRSNDD